jgi:hypothetical protein
MVTAPVTLSGGPASGFSERSKSSWRFGVVPGHAGCANGGRTAEADVKSSSEEKLGNRFSTACPVSVALRVRLHPDGPANWRLMILSVTWNHRRVSSRLEEVVQGNVS